MVKAVLFDLDDTLFDHTECARAALADLHRAHAPFQAHPFDEFARLHARFLEELHQRVLRRELTIEEARRERFRRLFEAAGMAADSERVAQAALAYRDGYQKVRQAVAGARELLARVRSRARVGVVSNNVLEEQQQKLRHCGLDAYVDALIVSDEVGVSKPEPEIFLTALGALGCEAAEAVMVGDSWAADIVGALGAGIRPVWFNPRGRPAPDPGAGVAELRAFQPPDAALSLIFGEGVPQHGDACA